MESKRSPDIVVPVAVEEVAIGKASRHERVRVRKSVHTHDELITSLVEREHVDITRVPVDRAVEKPPKVRVEGDTMIIPVVEEVVVYEKRLVLKEEIHVRKHTTIERQGIRVPLRAEEVAIERIDANGRNKKTRDP